MSSKLYIQLCVLVPLDEASHDVAVTLISEELVKERRVHRGLKTAKKRYSLPKCKIEGCQRTIRSGEHGMCRVHTDEYRTEVPEVNNGD